MRILIAKADVSAGQALCRSFEGYGAQCRLTTSGAGMIASLQSSSFDWVVFDLIMHDMTGEEAWRLAEEMFELLPPAIALSESIADDSRAISAILNLEACLNVTSSGEDIYECILERRGQTGGLTRQNENN